MGGSYGTRLLETNEMQGSKEWICAVGGRGQPG
jgi:hypothetical protein